MRNTKLKILLIENSSIIAEGISHILKNIGNVEIKQIENCEKAINLIDNYEPSAIIIDTRLTGYQLPHFINSCKEKDNSIGIIGLQTQYIPSEFITLFDEIISIEETRSTIYSKVTSSLHSTSDVEKNNECELSSREKDVLIAIAKGKSNKEIANELNLSIYTIMTHRKNISEKTGIKSISGLTVYALIKKLIHYEDVN